MANFSKDYAYELFQNPSRESFREYLKNSTGEMNDVDFKTQLEVDAKLAKHILGMANYGGGVIIFGVKQESNGDLDYVGVESLMDKADITKKLSSFLPSTLKYDIHEFPFEGAEYAKLENKKFQMIRISDTPSDLPFFSKKSSAEDIKKDDIYYRDGTNTVKADATQIRKILARMVRSQNSDTELSLNQHFEQLKMMYELIEKNRRVLVSSSGGMGAKIDFSGMNQLVEQIYGRREYKTVPNEYYPAESFEEFVSTCIQCKKSKIKSVLEIF